MKLLSTLTLLVVAAAAISAAPVVKVPAADVSLQTQGNVKDLTVVPISNDFSKLASAAGYFK